MPKKTERTKRKSSTKSQTKKTWEKFIKRSDSRSLLKDVWKVKHNESSLKERIKKYLE